VAHLLQREVRPGRVGLLLGLVSSRLWDPVGDRYAAGSVFGRQGGGTGA
jgi:hypothetical protein